jgi:hypothetical protein
MQRASARALACDQGAINQRLGRAEGEKNIPDPSCCGARRDQRDFAALKSHTSDAINAPDQWLKTHRLKAYTPVLPGMLPA